MSWGRLVSFDLLIASGCFAEQVLKRMSLPPGAGMFCEILTHVVIDFLTPVLRMCTSITVALWSNNLLLRRGLGRAFIAPSQSARVNSLKPSDSLPPI